MADKEDIAVINDFILRVEFFMDKLVPLKKEIEQLEEAIEEEKHILAHKLKQNEHNTQEVKQNGHSPTDFVWQQGDPGGNNEKI